MKPILLFDIDGTLLHVKREFLREVINQILTEFKFTSNNVKNRSFAGRTDRDIFMELIYDHTGSHDLFDEVTSRYKNLMNESLSPDAVDIIPGAAEFVEFAKSEGYEMGLCTGNFREVAYAKVESAGMGNDFSFGGFGCDHQERKHLPGLASRSYRNLYAEEAPSEAFVVIGDTPNDIQSAKYFNAKSVGVTTGHFGADELRANSPDLLVDSLDEIPENLSQLGFTKASRM
ncbi:HAD family hydrolase [Rhodohalobacter halophilus]|uniref:HAD family hydrolase n=1 Tax=Rhodohalobacter halophilus TaxID=1812810 RepID=UPI00083F5524|nr:HAD hydrolase-like protein [Rhodohalobacter halophilus]